ncbi:MAG: BrnT family toxin [Ardenticatenaceae bacterium]|nr:BrnT family toxin [Ardenticatenaceae bacterium]
MAFIFQWDKKKARQNLRDHRVSFEEASTVLGDTLSRTIDDPLHSEDEDRYVIIGQSARGRLLVVVHTIRGDDIRIISARVATPAERKDYEEGS